MIVHACRVPAHTVLIYEAESEVRPGFADIWRHCGHDARGPVHLESSVGIPHGFSSFRTPLASRTDGDKLQKRFLADAWKVKTERPPLLHILSAENCVISVGNACSTVETGAIEFGVIL